jgi:hypothetical protein
MPRVLLPLFALCVSAFAQLPLLRVSDDHRSLVTEDGKPFVYLADTAWELFHRLNMEEADRYLSDRAAKGFNVVQAVALAEFGGLTEPNCYGQLPLENNNPALPRDAYFKHVDEIVKKAASLGIYTALLPTWGDKVNKKWGQGPEIFTPDNARAYGKWLGTRYWDQPIIWILGGDRPIESDEQRAVWRALAEGLRAGDGGAHLMTYHPSGGKSSSRYVHHEEWLDFNMMQSGHRDRDLGNWKMIAEDLALKPPKPTLDGEPCYEDHPVRSVSDKSQWFDERDVRKLCYWALFAGACGHTYGTHSIWAMWDGKSKPLADQRTPWPEAMALPGSAQVGYARRLVESRPWLTRVPDQSLLSNEHTGPGARHCQALRGSDGSWAMIYSPTPETFEVKLERLSGEKLKTWWWNPRKGEAKEGETIAKSRTKATFTPPENGESPDWVLVLDDAGKDYPAPGAH